MGDDSMALRHVTTAALAAGLTVGALLAMPDASGRAAGGSAQTAASVAAILPLPTPHPKTLAAVPSIDAAPVATATAAPTTEPSPATSPPPPAALRPIGDVSGLTASGIPETALDAYRQAAAGAPCSIDWSLLAAIGRVESNHGRFGGASLHTDGLSAPAILGPALNGVGFALIRDTDGGVLDGDATLDRAVGPMQFIPSTWRRWATDGDGDGAPDPQNLYDATATAAAYLCHGRDLSTEDGLRAAYYSYNRSQTYVETVLAHAEGYAQVVIPPAPPA
jgi:membrane-bound lytic murein transglycosylase B